MHPDSIPNRSSVVSPLDLAVTLPLLFGLVYMPVLLWLELINREVLDRVIFGFINEQIFARFSIDWRLYEIPEPIILVLAALPATLALRWMLQMIRLGSATRA